MTIYDLRVVNSARELYSRMSRPICEKYDLTSIELAVLMFLQNYPGRDTSADIARERHIAKSHVSVAMRGLNNKGLISCERQPGNKLKLHLSLTEEARPIIEDGLEAQHRFEEILLRGCSEKEKSFLVEMLHRIGDNVDAALD